MVANKPRRVPFEVIRRTVPLTTILEHYGVLRDLKKHGRQLHGACPIHGGSNPRQFVVDPIKSLWRCFSPRCGRGGSTLEFVADMERCSLTDAADLISRWFGIRPVTTTSQHKHRSNTMSDESKRQPSHRAFLVDGEGDDAFWHRCGSAWPTKKGNGLTLVIPPGMSISGRVVLVENKDDEEEDDGKAKRSRK